MLRSGAACRLGSFFVAVVQGPAKFVVACPQRIIDCHAGRNRCNRWYFSYYNKTKQLKDIADPDILRIVVLSRACHYQCSTANFDIILETCHDRFH